MGIVLLVLGALISLGGWGVLGTGFGLEQTTSAASGLSYLPSATSSSIDGYRVTMVQQAILLGYFLMTVGVILLASNRVVKILREQAELELPLDHVEPLAPIEPAKSARREADLTPAAQTTQHLAEARKQAGAVVEETVDDDFDDAAGFAQIVQEGEIEGHHFIEYDNGIVDVQTHTGWRRFDSLEQAVNQLRLER